MVEDYRALCLELFGTDDEGRLRKIADSVGNRNAGRKRKFTKEDIIKIKKLRANGASINCIANEYHTTRQVVGKYLRTKPENGFTMRMTYMYVNKPCTTIDIDFLNQRILIENYTSDLLRRAFGMTENPTWEDFEDFLEYRCFSKTNGNARRILADLNLNSYDPLQIVEKTRGRIADDNMWLKIKYYHRDGEANETIVS